MGQQNFLFSSSFLCLTKTKRADTHVYVNIYAVGYGMSYVAILYMMIYVFYMKYIYSILRYLLSISYNYCV